jgi:hypothetical protein
MSHEGCQLAQTHQKQPVVVYEQDQFPPKATGRSLCAGPMGNPFGPVHIAQISVMGVRDTRHWRNTYLGDSLAAAAAAAAVAAAAARCCL